MNDRKKIAQSIQNADSNRSASSMNLQHDKNFNTILSPQEEAQFKSWKAKNAPHDSGQDYDLRGAFKAHLEKDIKSGHWSDRFKKPNHPTFSDQSQYAKEAPNKAGHWEGDKYIPPKG